MTNTIPEIIIHYQKSIEKSENDRARLLHCLSKLYKLPITVVHLQETGIGRTVNTLRKDDGEVGVSAKALVAKWKAMVAAEESSEEDGQAATSTVEDDDDMSPKLKPSNGKAPAVVEPPKSSSHRSKDSKSESSASKHRSSSDKTNGHHHHHKKSSSASTKEQPVDDASAKTKSSSSSHKTSNSSSSRKDSSKHSSFLDADMFKPDVVTTVPTPSKSVDPAPTASKEHHRKSHKSSSRSKTDDGKKASSSSKSSTSPDKSHSNRTIEGAHKRKSEASTSSKHHETKSSPSAAKRPKIEVAATGDSDDDMEEIDSSMGTSFADALGMSSPSKKSSSSSKSKKVLKPSTKTSVHTTPKPTSSSSKMSAPSSSTPSSSKPKVESKQIDLKKPPSLLVSANNLQPLDLQISLDLPTISNNYRPQPLNPVIMDCVYNKSGASGPVKTFMTDEELGASMSSKTQRTKVYSGVKTGAVHNVTSLEKICIRVLQRNIDALEFTGGVPYVILKPVIERASPKQLSTMEYYNPYLIEDTDELWKLHCSRKFRTQKPHEFESWREMFLRCTDEQDDRLSHLTNNIKLSQKIAVPVKQTKITYVDQVVKPPRDVQKKQMRYNTDRILVATPAARVASLNKTTSNIARPGDVRLRVAAGIRDHAQVQSAYRPKKAPLMAQTLKSMKAFKR